MATPETWLPIVEAAVYGGCSVKALRRRIERGTVISERRENGRRYVLISSLTPRGHAPPRPAGNTPAAAPQPAIGELLARLESLAAENGKLRALTEVAESTEQRLANELAEARTRLQAAEQRLARRRWWRRSKDTVAAS
jgi:DNA-binding transcriptional MerR regulator